MTHRFIEGMLSKIGKGKISTASLDVNIANLKSKSPEELAKIVDAQSELLIAQKNKIGELDSQIEELAELVKKQNTVLKDQSLVIKGLQAKLANALSGRKAPTDKIPASALNRDKKAAETRTGEFLRRLFTREGLK